MLSTTEYQFIKDLTIDFYNNGYRNYFCYTNTPTNNYYQYEEDVICYYSRSDITFNNYTLSLSNDTYKCEIDSKSPTSNYKTESLNCYINNNSNISINDKEFVYSNVGYNSNLIADYETSLNNHLDLNYAYFIGLALILPILIGFVHHFFRID